MNTFEKRFFLVNTGVIAIILLFIDTKTSLFFIAGAILSIFMYLKTARMTAQFLSLQPKKNTLVYLHFATNYAIMAIGMILGVKLGGVTCLFSYALGLTMVKLAVILSSLFKRKEER